MRILVLGGTHFVGRAVVEAALERGDEVTLLNRGVSGPTPDGVTALRADRRDADQLASALSGKEWDAVIDTWAGAPRVVQDSVRLLAQRVAHYGYVSSRSVYAWPIPVGADESAPLVDGDPTSDDNSDYAAAKRGGELAVVQAFPGRCLLARAGLILGPYEDVGRLPWWLGRIEDGGRVLAPGPRDRKLQYIDARDLAAWMLTCAERGDAGAFNAVSEPGHATMEELLTTCVDVTGSDAELIWTPPEVLEAAGVYGWTQLPIWVPPTGELAALHDCDVTAALLAGLRCRPVRETVADTWAWMRSGEASVRPRRYVPTIGLDRELERQILT
jgi:nucleoside-diphosphate-sugar epimerase